MDKTVKKPSSSAQQPTAQQTIASNPFNSLLPGLNNQVELPTSSAPAVLDTSKPTATTVKPTTWRDTPAAQQQAQTVQEEKYDGVLGFLRGVGESAISGIRSANEAIAGWLSDATPNFIRQETEANLVNIDADAARAAADAATGTIQASYSKDEQSRAGGARRANQASEYLSQRSEEIHTGADTERLYQEAADSQEEAARIREYAVGDSGAIAKLLFDAGVGGVQLLYDTAVNALVPGAGLWSAAARGAGSGILEAQQSGANLLQQLAYGLGVGAVEAATEKISNLAGPLRRVFGGGVADRAITSLVNRLTSSTAGRAVLNLAANAAGEGFEEFVSSVANPALRRIFDENAFAEYGDPQMWADAAYDALVGATIGGIVGLPGTVTAARGRGATTTEQTNNETPSPMDESVERFARDVAEMNGESTSVNTNPAEHTAVEQRVIDDYQNAVDENLVQFVSDSISNRGANSGRYELSPVSDRAANDIQRITGVDTHGNRTVLEQRMAEHIYNEHGVNGTTDQSMRDLNDIGRIQWVLDNYDDVVDGGATRSYVTNRGNGRIGPARTVVFSKAVNGIYYVVEAAPNARNKTNYIVSAYMAKNKPTGARTADAEAPAFTASPENPQPVSNNIIPNSERPVNTSGIPNSSAVSPTDSLGAAPAGFDRFSAAIEQYGEMPERGTGAREMSIPNATNDDTVIPRTVQTFANAEATPETAYTDITRLIEQGNFDRAVITDQASLSRAEETITREGFNRALTDWTATVRRGKVSKDTTTLGLTLYNNAINAGDTQTAIQILVDIVDNARTAAQATQAMNILNKLTPEGRLYSVQRTVASLQQELQRKYGDLAPNLKIDETLAANFLNEADENARFEALDEIYKDIANQIPQDWYDKLNSWRYFAMLANPRTHIRNLVGNTAMAGLTAIRNRISSSIQQRFVSDANQRTRETISRRRNAEDEARYQVGFAEYSRINDMLGDAGKYNNELNRIRRHMKAPFTSKVGKAVGKAIDFNSALLENEDLFFSRRAYASSIAQILKARGITAEEYTSGSIGQEAVAEIQAYALREAQRLTFRDFNAFSNFVQRIATLGGDSTVGRIWQTIVGANTPFTRAPANIVVRGVADYSPMGLMRGVTNLFTKVRRGDMTAGEAIDQLSSGLVGTALLGLGALLAKLGVITGGGSDDDEQRAFDELRGFQPYSIQIGGRSYTLDWLAPAALPFFTGAEIWNQFAGDGSRDEDTGWFEAILQGLGHMTDPMLEMSMLSGISDLLDSVAYYQGTNSIWPVLSASVTNYISQFFPSVFGAIERTFEDTRQSSYTDPSSPIPDDLQYPISQALNRFFGEYNQVDYIDAWGRTESTGNALERIASNFVSPGYMSTLSTDEVEDELQRIYDATGGEYSIFPDRATMGNTTINGERLTPEQYTEYATLLGQTRYAEVSALMETSAFKAMSDVEKAKAIEAVYDYAAQTAKHAIDPEYEVDSKFTEASEYGSPSEYLAFREAWQSVQDSKGADTDAFLSVIEDYENMTSTEQNTLLEMLGENSRFDDVVEAYEAGVSPEDWYNAYDEWKAIGEEGKASDNATEFANWLETQTDFSQEQADILKDQLAYYTMVRSDPSRYETLRDAGFSADQALDLYYEIGTMNTYTSDGVSGGKKAKVVAHINRLNLTPQQKDYLYLDIMGYSQSGLAGTPWH